MSWTFTVSGSAIIKAGADASTTVTDFAILTEFSDETEGMICKRCRWDFRDSYSSLDQDTKDYLKEIASSDIARKIIWYDMKLYGRRIDAQTLLDINTDIVEKGIATLSDSKQNEIKAV
jgi:hypothetical protein